MKKKLAPVLFFLWLIYMCYGLIVSYYELNPVDQTVKIEDLPKYYDYKGVTHSLSKKSRGSGSFEELVAAGNTAKLDFLFITDQNPFFEERIKEQYIDGTRVYFGGRYSYVDSILMVYGGEDLHQFHSLGQSQILLNDLITQKNRSPQNMSIFLAHPTKNNYRWSGDYPVGMDGFEVINLKQIWQKKAMEDKLHFLFSLFLYPFNSTVSYINIIQDPTEELQLWDQMLAQRKFVGVLGNESTAKAIILPTDGGYIKFPAYSTSFQMASNHILLDSELTGNLKRDKEKILEAIHNGRLYMSFDVLGNPKGFYAEYISENTKVTLGEEAKYEMGSKIIVNLPYRPRFPFEVQLFKDGKLYTTSNQHDVEFQISSPGVYRVHVFLKPELPFLQGSRWLPWIISNPIYLR
tara:strand:+ start:1732 stop:2949 length:1218 start_codon:yes stop_codon:yes gene_type:complete